ncbi:unnamed protein product [Absidia cylindrospora]
MTDKLPPNLLKLFAPRPPLNYLPPLDKNPEKRVGAIVTGIASFVPLLKIMTLPTYLGKQPRKNAKKRLNFDKRKRKKVLLKVYQSMIRTPMTKYKEIPSIHYFYPT